MQRKILSELQPFPQSIVYDSTKNLLAKLTSKLSLNKDLGDKRQSYSRIIKELDWSMGKVEPSWPKEIQRTVDNMKSVLEEFQALLNQTSQGSSFFCGSRVNPKQIDQVYTRILGYEHIFSIIGTYQDKKITQKIVQKAVTVIEKENSHSGQKSMGVSSFQNASKYDNKSYKTQRCQYCDLMLAVSLCPNGYVAKKLVKQLPNTQWIAGIIYQEGNIVDKDLSKSISYYEKASKKGNAEAIYRLGSLNQRGLYGKPYEYLKMWEQASQMNHLQALTDLGYLYENGLSDENDHTLLQENQDKAFSYYKKASQKNFPRALNNLATFYFNNSKYKNTNKCIQYLEMAAQAEYVKSLHNLGLIYYQGTVVPADAKKSRSLIKRAAEKGDIQGRIMYIQTMLNDVMQCSSDDLSELNRYCREIIAKDQQNSQAYYFLGIMYEQGYGVPKFPKIAFLYYQIASIFNNDTAIMKLGSCYCNGFGIEQDTHQAIRCYDRAAKTNAQAFIYLGQIYEKGSHDMKQNYQTAYNYYSKGASQGISEAYIHLGNMYRNGHHVKRNEATAQEYYEKGKKLRQKNSLSSNRLASSSDLIQSSYYRRK